MAQSRWYRIQVEQDTAFPAGSPRFCDRARSIEHVHNRIRAAAGREGEGSQVRPPRSWCCRWGSRREPGVPHDIGVHMGRIGSGSCRRWWDWRQQGARHRSIQWPLGWSLPSASSSQKITHSSVEVGLEPPFGERKRHCRGGLHRPR